MDLARVAGYKKKSTVFPNISRLRAKGHNIVFLNGLYYMKSRAPAAATLAENKIETHNKTRNITKHERLLAMPQEAGDQGVLRRDLARDLNIELKNLIYRIHFLREQRYQIGFKNDRYFITGKPSAVSEPEEAPEAPPDLRTAPINLYDPVSSHAQVVKNLSPDNRVTYLCLLIKAKFYTGCVESLVSANRVISQIEKEVSREI